MLYGSDNYVHLDLALYIVCALCCTDISS